MSKVYEKLRKVVNKINHPNGVLLEFGCEIVFTNTAGNSFTATLIEPESMSMFLNTTEGQIFKKKLVKNLGPDLSLQSILRACSVVGGSKIMRIVLRALNNQGIVLDIDKKPKDREEEKHLQLLELLDV